MRPPGDRTGQNARYDAIDLFRRLDLRVGRTRNDRARRFRAQYGWPRQNAERNEGCQEVPNRTRQTTAVPAQYESAVDHDDFPFRSRIHLRPARHSQIAPDTRP